MVILCPLSFRFRELSDKCAETNYAPFVIQEQQLERWAEINYGHSAHLLSTKRNEFDSIRMMQVVGTDHFQNFCRFRWQGVSPTEWCFSRTKLMSYLYFPFISNKRQVKRGNCHTLILSGNHPLLGCDPRLTTSRYLAPIVRQFVKFCDMPEVKTKHCCTTREIP